MFYTEKKGFTLIELLVVIAIIGLLSSVILTSLNAARTKARDASLKRSALELRSVLELARADLSSFTNVNTTHNQFFSPTTGSPGRWSCDDIDNALMLPNIGTLAPAHRNKILEICKDIMSKGNYASGAYVIRLWHGESPAPTTNCPLLRNRADKYSITVLLSSNKPFCVGSNGKTSIGANDGMFNVANGQNPGCHCDPSL